MRANTIRISADEQALLDDVAQDRYGTQEVPYGAVVEALAKDYLNDT